MIYLRYEVNINVNTKLALPFSCCWNDERRDPGKEREKSLPSW